MERTTMQVNGSRPSLSSIRSSLNSICDSINEMTQLYKAAMCKDPDVNMRGYLAVGAKLKSIILELQAIKVLVRQRKEAEEAMPKKGNIFLCFKFPTLFVIRMYESDVKDLESEIAGLADDYMKLAKELNIWDEFCRT